MFEAQRHAARAIGQVLAGRSLDETLRTLFSHHPEFLPRQRAAIQDLSYGALRHYGLLAALLDQLLQKPLTDEPLRCLLLAALYQLEVGKSAPHAVVDHAVRAAQAMKKDWGKGLVNAVLRNRLRGGETLRQAAITTSEVARHSHPQWWIDRLRNEYPDDWTSVLAAGCQHPPMTLRVNRRVLTRDDYLTRLRAQGLEADPVGVSALRLHHPVAVDALPGFAEGWVSVQDAGAQLAAPLLDVADGMRVLDACAAPGGKTAHLLEQADLELTALDCDAGRLAKVAQNFDRLHLTARCIPGDAAKPEDWWDGQPFQRILADVPCSASGVARRHPDSKWLRRERDIAAFAARQAEILDALWRLLGRGGKLLYATCSVFPEENRCQTAAFCARQADAQALPTDLPRGGQLLPDDHHDGFYYALFLKT